MKPKKNQKETPDNLQDRDNFQTPFYATDLIAPFIPVGMVWECAAGNGYIRKRLSDHGRDVIFTDLKYDPSFNFLTGLPFFEFDVIVTNPPFSLKRKFFEKCMSYKKPFALLIPADYSGWILRAMQNGAQWLIPTRRIDYITPTGKTGEESKAQFHSGWLTYGFDFPERVNIVELTNEMKLNTGFDLLAPLYGAVSSFQKYEEAQP